MKCLQRCCCLLCALVLLLTVFSLSAHAKELEIGEYYIEHSIQLKNLVNGYTDTISAVANPFNDNQDSMTVENHWRLDSTSYQFITSYEVVPDSSILFAKGGTTSVAVLECYYGMYFTNLNTGNAGYERSIDSARMLVTYSDNTTQYFDNVTYSISGASLNLSCEFTPDKDVKYVKFIVYRNRTITPSYNVTVYLGEIDGTDKGFGVSVSQQSEESGLLSGILGWVQNIFNKIGDTFTEIKNGFSNIGKWFSELPSKLWDVISEGLKSLFVPDEEFIVQYKDDMDSMLSDKLGAVYQVIDITLESWDRINASDEQNTINLPLTTIDLPENNKFSFGGYDVKIVPDGFDVLANAIKLISGICVTILFVNGLRKKYDEIMGVEK